MNRQAVSFRFRAQSARCSAFRILRLKAVRAFLAHYVIWMGLGCCVVGVLLFTSEIVPLWGQSTESVPATPPPEEINPQYEYNVKAAFLYSFGRYLIWPERTFTESSGAFVLGVCGEDPFGQVLDRIAQVKTIQGHRIVIQRMASIEALKPCHILFISRSIPAEQQAAIIKKLQGKAVLLVGEVSGFAEQGGGINFYVEAGTVRFEINVDAIQQEGLLLDAKLMSLGKKVSAPVTQ